MKELAYAHFHPAWDPKSYSRAATELGIRFVAGYGDDKDFKPGGQERPPPGVWFDIEEPGKVDNLHRLDREEFLREVAKSKMMLGIGLPEWSPSPYDALCLGVPFLNPVSTEPCHPEALIASQTPWLGCHSNRFGSGTTTIQKMKLNGSPNTLNSLDWDLVLRT